MTDWDAFGNCIYCGKRIETTGGCPCRWQQVIVPQTTFAIIGPATLSLRGQPIKLDAPFDPVGVNWGLPKPNKKTPPELMKPRKWALCPDPLSGSSRCPRLTSLSQSL